MVVIHYLSHSWCLLKSDFDTIRMLKVNFRTKYNNAYYMLEAIKEKYANSTFDGYKYFIEDDNKIPTGLLPRLIAFLESKKIQWKIIDQFSIRKRKFPEKLDFQLKDPKKDGQITLYPHQQEAVISALNYTRGILAHATNAGKTEEIASIIKNLMIMNPDIIIFIIVPSIQLFENTGARLAKELGFELNNYYEKNRSIMNVNITTIQTLHYENKNTIKSYFSKVDCFFIDEYHIVGSSKNWSKIIMNVFENAKYRFGLTGTVKVDDSVKEYTLECITGSIISKITNNDLIKAGISVRPIVHFLKMKIDNAPTGLKYHTEIKYTFENTCFWMKFLNYFYSISTGGNFILISNIAHGELFNKYIKNSVFLSGKDKVEKRNKILKDWAEGKYGTLIATQIFRYGLDTNGIQKLFIFSIGSKTSKVLQEIGRGLRKNKTGKVDIYFMDFTNLRYFNQFAQEQEYIVKKEGFEIKKVDLK